MSKPRATEKDGRVRLEYVHRSNLSVQKVKLKPSVSQQPSIPPADISTLHLETLPSTSSKLPAIKTSTQRSPDESSRKPKLERLTSLNIVTPTSPIMDNTQSPKTTQNSDLGLKNWYSRLTSKQKLLLTVVAAALIVLAVALIIVLAVYFTVIRRKSESSFTNTTVSTCAGTTCIGQETPYRTSIITVLYPFDGNYNDLTGYATGTPYGSLSFASYPGYVSQAVSFSTSNQQYVQIPVVNLSERSFTLQAWLFPGSLAAGSDLGIFGQCDSSSICLSFSLRSARFALSFDSMNAAITTLTGASVITGNSWVHVTVVYDDVLFQQRIYVNGHIDAVSSGIVSSFRGNISASTTSIGKTSSLAFGTSFYVGRLDHFTISAGVARSACQIFNDASLVVYYAFESTSIWNDYSVNLCNGVAGGMTAVPLGRVGHAVSFASTTSYFQSQCFPRMRAGDQSFSVSMWIMPTSVIAVGSLVHISSNPTGSGICYDLLAFTPTGALVCQWMQPPSNVNSTLGPAITSNTWTHVAVVYGSANGVRLFINGQFSASSANVGSLALQDTNTALYITLANVGSVGPPVPSSCSAGSIPLSSGSFTGQIDEFRLYNRELDNQEICVLADL